MPGIPGMPASGNPVTAWAGTGLDLAAIALIGAALLGLDGLSGRMAARASGRRLRWRQAAVAPVVAAAVIGVLGSVAFAGWLGVGDIIRAVTSGVPAVAADQASGPLAGRLLVLDPQGDALGYQLVGVEPGAVARALPGPVQPADSLLAAAVRAVLADSTAASAGSASARLSDLAVGFVGYRGRPTSPIVSRLDSTAGLARLGDSHGLVLWRVLARAGARTHAATAAPVGSARVRLEDTSSALLQNVDVAGAHGAAHTQLPAGARGRRLVVAEPLGWSARATVSYDGHGSPRWAAPPSPPTWCQPAPGPCASPYRRPSPAGATASWAFSLSWCSWPCPSAAAVRGGRHEGRRALGRGGGCRGGAGGRRDAPARVARRGPGPAHGRSGRGGCGGCGGRVRRVRRVRRVQGARRTGTREPRGGPR